MSLKEGPMPLESATYISDLNISNPANSDGLNQADDHMRLIKSTLKSSFPNFTAAPLNSTQANIDGAATQFARNGDVPPGFIMDFGGSTAPAGWLVCDGQAVSRTTYADLFAALGNGTIWGAGDGSTTFNVPPLTGRFRRNRDNGANAGTIGTLKGPTNLTHTHTGSGTTTGNSVDHVHGVNFVSGAMNSNASHAHGVSGASAGGTTTSGVQGGGTFNGIVTSGTTTIVINAANTDHTHNVIGNTGGASAPHTHDYSFTTSASGDANESRPLSAAVLTCIKT